MLTPWSNPAMWHAINVHLPIVLALLGLPLVCVVAITRGRHRALRWGVVTFYALITASAWFAAETGESAMDKLPPALPQVAWDRINFHEEMAEKVSLIAAITMVLLLLANIPRRWARQTFTTLGLIFSVILVGWVAVTAHSGGVAVYEHSLGTVAMHQQYGAEVVATTLPATTQLTTTQPAPAAVTTSGQVVSFTRDIQPLLSVKCSECHAGTDLKGGFDVSTIASILKGGKKAGGGFVAGKPDGSAIVHYIEGKKQPRMPKGAKPLEDAEIALIRAWIAGGATEDVGAKLADAATTNPTPIVEEKINPDWDPQVQFGPAESVAVRRFVRLKNLLPPPAPPKVDGKVYNVLDQFIVAKWKDDPRPATPQAAATPTTTPATTQAAATQAATTQATTQVVADTGICDDATFVRRVYLDLVGVIPTAADAKKFVEDKDEKKREKLIDGLLGRTRDYAANWVPWWEEALTSNGLHQGGVGTHGNYRAWIFANFDQNKPYDVMVQELLDPSMPNHPQRYILNDNHMRTVQSSSDVAQVFLGTAIKCASCHSHFLNDEWPQQRAVGFAGFFSDKDMELVRCERKTGQFVKTHFMFDLPAAPTSAPSDPNARLKRIAQLVTDPTNPRFAKTIVNRLWKRYMGLGLFEPADDYREDTPPSHPELLNWLADDFIRHGYDIKHTVQLILTSRTYQLKYDPAVEDHFDIEKPKAPRYFRSPSLRRLTAEQLLDSIAVTMEQKLPDRRAYQNDESTTLTRSLGKPAARNEVATARPDDTAVVQALELLNGKEYHDRIYKGALIDEMSVDPKIDELVGAMYWSTYSRPPTAKEKEVAIQFVKSAPAPAATLPSTAPAPTPATTTATTMATTAPTTKPAGVEVVWLDDDLPAGATKAGNWKFVGAPDNPVFSGKLSHTEAEPFPGPIQHLFTGGKFAVAPKDTIFVYVYLDAKAPPKEIMIQLHSAGDWKHRAAWGENVIEFKPKITLGALPKAGEWVRLEIPAEKIGVAKGATINGISFDQVGGKMYWDKLGAAKGPPIHDPQTIGDMIWALVTGPEFQYVK